MANPEIENYVPQKETPPKVLDIYIAASWKHQHAVELLTEKLRSKGHTVRSFVENNHGEGPNKRMSFDQWMETQAADQSFMYDTCAAAEADVTIYIGPSGKDAAFEAGICFASKRILLGLWGKGEDFGLMRKALRWHTDYRELLRTVDVIAGLA